MSLILNTNSYVDVAYADGYFSERLYTAEWDALTTANDTATKEKALIQATRFIDTQRLKGTPTVDTQPLHFPIDGNTDVPIAIKNAVCGKALSLLKQGDNTLKAGELKSVQVDGVTESYTTNLDIVSKGSNEDKAIMYLLKPYMINAVSIVR